MRLLADLPVVYITTKAQSDGNHGLRPIDMIHVQLAMLTTLIRWTWRMLIMKSWQSMMRMSWWLMMKRCCVSPIAGLMWVLIHQQ